MQVVKATPFKGAHKFRGFESFGEHKKAIKQILLNWLYLVRFQDFPHGKSITVLISFNF